MMRRAFIACRAFLVGCLLATPTLVHAQHILVRAGYGAPDGAQARLAEVAVPQTLQVAPAQDPIEVARSLCGVVLPKYLALFSAANVAGAQAPAPITRTLVFPACFYIESEGPRPILPGESIPAFAQRVIGASGPKTLERLRALNSGKSSAAKMLRVNFATVPMLYALNEKWRDDPAAAAAYIAESFADQKVIVEQIVSTRPDDLIPMTGIVKNSRVQCVLSPQAAARPLVWPFDAEAVVGALLRNDRYRREHGMAPAVTATVAVADNGFDGLGGAHFPDTLLVLNAGERPRNGIDDDKNRFIDDFRGVALYGTGDPVPVPLHTLPHRDHGTLMASLALGGPRFQTLSVEAGLARVRVLPISMVQPRTVSVVNQGNVTTYGYPAEGLTSALLYANRKNADVVSFSVGTPAHQDGFVGYLNQPMNELLIVAAAGNDANDYGVRALHPAAYGVNQDGYVITVGAADKFGCLAAFSGRGANRVDLLAPGVEIPAIGMGGGETVLDGTSHATALVSFTIALLKSEGYSDRAAIRDRLYATVDRSPTLKEWAASEGVLNIANAVSVHHDLIQFDPGGPVLAGQLRAPLQLDQICARDDAEGAKILRIEWRKAEGEALLMFRGKGTPRNEWLCRPDDAAMTIWFTPEGEAERELRLDAIHLVIPR